MVLKGLQVIWETVCDSPYERSLFHTVSLLAFFKVLKVSRLVAMFKKDILGRPLALQDVHLHDGRLSITIQVSKTDQHGQGRLFDHAQMTTVTTVPIFLAVRGSGEGTLLCNQDGSPLTKYQ